jgi:hypothetical protein
MRKPVGITVPYREVGFKTLEEQVKEVEKRVIKLENLYEENRSVQAKAKGRDSGAADATTPVQRS